MGKGDNKKVKESKKEQELAKKEEVSKRAAKRTKKATQPQAIFFDKSNYTFIGIGLLVVIVGLLLMSGGNNPPDNWDANAIYNWRRITLAPFVIIVGLAVVVYAIFKPTATQDTTSE